MREFDDSKGVHWAVWATVPRAASVVDSFRGGWLTFVSAKSRRRLLPIPGDWEEASVARLEQLCTLAPEVRSTPNEGTQSVDADAR